MSELKPCPFCGEPADDRYNRLAKCSNKSCLMNHWVDDEDFFIDDDWNTRPIEDALRARIAELSQALGLITTLKPTMVMDADHPLDMAKEVVEYVSTIITNTQQANRGLGANYVYELNENIKLTARIAELEAIIDKLVEGIDSLTSGFPLEIEYVEAVEIAKDWKKGRE